MQELHIKEEFLDQKQDNKQIIQNKTVQEQILLETRYEDKYWDKFGTIDNAFNFQEEDLLMEQQKLKDLLDNYQEDDVTSTEEKLEEVKLLSYEHMLSNFLKKNKNNYIIENTPLGNVAMNFNVEKGSFEYYSDKNIPYRFLETVARRYVITFHCKPLYICMDNEIQLAEQKMKEQKELLKNASTNSNAKFKTKDIFANFKNNKSVQSIQPVQINKSVRKDNNPNGFSSQRFQHLTNPNHNNNNNSQILKENANRYTHLGKFSNFILIKIPTKQDKKSALSYRDYIKLNKS